MHRILTEVLIFMPQDEPMTRYWMVACWRFCMERGYKPVAVVHDWIDALGLMKEGRKVVAMHRSHVDWLEVVSEAHDEGEPRRGSQRTGRTSEGPR